jgi:peptidoglycan/LPS O-acetylase OafA/YrhL
LEYRKEIDGLRAIALIPVILYHAGFSTFSGGFIGVDVFFVISGFLITSIILKDLNSGEFGLAHFYERRARRILPALSLVMFVCLLAAWVFMDPHNYALLSRSMVATSTFSSNVYFYLVSGYFDIASDEKPLLHTWSLAVEEQFYIIVPFCLGYFWYQKNRNLVLVLALACIASFMTSVVLSYYPGNANFYLLFSRAWELLVGVLLAYLPTNTNSGHKVAFSACALGLGMIVYSVLFYNQQTPYPGFYTLFPVAGAALIIRYGAIVNPVSSMLKFKPIVFIGLISYSLYLWHFPILAFMRLKTIGELQASNVYLAIAISFLIASLSWKLELEACRKTFSKSEKFQFSDNCKGVYNFHYFLFMCRYVWLFNGWFCISI